MVSQTQILTMERPQMLSSVQGRITEILIVLPGVPNEIKIGEYEQIVEIFDKKGTIYRFKLDIPDVNVDREGHGRSGESTYRGETTKGFPETTYRHVEDLNSKIDWKGLIGAWKDELKELQSGKENLHYKRWAQDPFISLSWNEATILLKSTFNSRMCDFMLPFEIAAQGGKLIFIKPTELYLEGGNLLRGLDAVFVGSDTVSSNQEKLNVNREIVLEKLAETLGVEKIIEIGLPVAPEAVRPSGPVYRGGQPSVMAQPIFHIDVFMNLGGRSKVDDREIVFVANMRFSRKLLENPPFARIKKLQAELPKKDPFEAVRTSLDPSTFEVIDMPIFLHEGIWYSWNNCLVEVDGDHRHVYLPSYLVDGEDEEQLNSTFKILEDEVEEIYEQNGFTFTWISDGKFFRKIAQWGGSLHCIAKVLRRE
jgi:hypothetical protein